jgi:D-glycero-D-manno-heptose 1,7-bisphosphate phosphatase
MIKCVFLDRDGIINKDTGYFYNYKKIIWNQDIFKTIKFIKKKKIKISVVTNQSGIARGYYKEKDVIKLHKQMNDYIYEKTGYKIDNFQYCPFLKNGKIKKYRKNSYYRKPNPGMINFYIKKEKLKKEECLLFGDRFIDIICAKKAGIKGFLIKNNNFYKFIKRKILDN